MSARVAELAPLPPGGPGLMAARPGPDLEAVGWSEREYVARGEATSYVSADGDLPPDGRWTLWPDTTAPYATRVLVRRPVDPAAASGTVVLEWLNVSSGQDAGPDWTYLADELVRQGHAWVGVSAQRVGVEGGHASVAVTTGSTGLKGNDPQRYADLHHPGDAYCYDLVSQVGRALRDNAADEHPLAGLPVSQVLAVGESQSAFALTTYLNGVHPLDRVFDGYLVHSRGGAAAPLGRPGEGFVMADVITGRPTRIRDDLDVPVVVVQTETDLFGRIGYLPARQDDSDLLRIWEVAGAAHADLFQIGEFESFLGCPWPVNRGQQVYVVRAALRHLERWARGGDPAPSAPRLEVDGDGYATDAVGNALGGVRTPCVDVPTSVLSGLVPAGASVICQLFGRTTSLSPQRLRELYPTREDYLAAYERATDAAIAAGFVLPEDRDQVLAEAAADFHDGRGASEASHETQ